MEMDGKKKREREREAKRERERERYVRIEKVCALIVFARVRERTMFERKRTPRNLHFLGKTRQTVGNAIDSRSLAIAFREIRISTLVKFYSQRHSVNRILDEGTLKFDNYSRVAEKLTFSSAGATAVRRDSRETLSRFRYNKMGRNLLQTDGLYHDLGNKHNHPELTTSESRSLKRVATPAVG